MSTQELEADQEEDSILERILNAPETEYTGDGVYGFIEQDIDEEDPHQAIVGVYGGGEIEECYGVFTSKTGSYIHTVISQHHPGEDFNPEEYTTVALEDSFMEEELEGNTGVNRLSD